MPNARSMRAAQLQARELLVTPGPSGPAARGATGGPGWGATENVSVVELAEVTGLAKDVISARCAGLVKARCIDSSRRGTFRIQQDRIERFLDSLVTA